MLLNQSMLLQRSWLLVCLSAVMFLARISRADEPVTGTEQPLSAEVLAERARQSLVVVRATDRTGSDSGLGTGFVIEGGLIATAHHVIGDGREIRVELPGGRLVPV
ncbi:MAG: hypothetical protein ACK5YO_28330, partial [Planctomyces sp.]